MVIQKEKPKPTTNLLSEIQSLRAELKYGDLKQETLKKKKQFKWPFKWRATMRRSLRDRNKVLVLYLNVKGDIEPPRLLPIESGNMVIVKSRPYEVDPRAFWRLGKYKCLLIKEIDRRPVSNLDYVEIKRRGDATDSDEFLIKTAMRAVQLGSKKPIKVAAVILVVVIIGVVVYLMATALPGAPAVAAAVVPQVVTPNASIPVWT
jgi:hypothetical protein|tara:strand:- start:1131 stop:1745 length:615 start_codon:yes stop_codon:yes gene_type:complete